LWGVNREASFHIITIGVWWLVNRIEHIATNTRGAGLNGGFRLVAPGDLRLHLKGGRGNWVEGNVPAG